MHNSTFNKLTMLTHPSPPVLFPCQLSGSVIFNFLPLHLWRKRVIVHRSIEYFLNWLCTQYCRFSGNCWNNSCCLSYVSIISSFNLFLISLNLDVFISFLSLFFQVVVFLKSTYFRYKFKSLQDSLKLGYPGKKSRLKIWLNPGFSQDDGEREEALINNNLSKNHKDHNVPVVQKMHADC